MHKLRRHIRELARDTAMTVAADGPGAAAGIIEDAICRGVIAACSEMNLRAQMIGDDATEIAQAMCPLAVNVRDDA